VGFVDADGNDACGEVSEQFRGGGVEHPRDGFDRRPLVAGAVVDAEPVDLRPEGFEEVRQRVGVAEHGAVV